MPETNPRLQQVAKKRISIKAIASFVLSLIAFVITCDFFSFMKIRLPHFPWWNIYAAGISLFTSVILTARFLADFKRSEEKLRGAVPALIGGIMNVLVILWLFVVVFFNAELKKLYWAGGRWESFLARKNLQIVYHTLRLYANTFGDLYPSENEWCDLLVDYCKLDPLYLASPYRKGPLEYVTTDPNTDPNISVDMVLVDGYVGCDGVRYYTYGTRISDYALNPYCEMGSPRDTVLLYGADSGWNLFGGPEFMTFEHRKGRMCPVLFNDGHVEFVKPEDVSKLRWQPEKTEP